MFEHIILEQEQKALLAALVEAARNTPRENRRPFYAITSANTSQDTIAHPGLANGSLSVYSGDIEVLKRLGLINVLAARRGQASFDVSPLGYQFYEYIKQAEEQPVLRVEAEIVTHLDAEPFRRKYPRAHEKWAAAEALLWSSDSEGQWTTIGHLCREAIQEFATALVAEYQPPGVDLDKAHDKNRVRAVLDQRSANLGNSEKSCLDALTEYWETVSALVQRQEHGGQREGKPLIWEDARRVVFLTMVVMFEVDRSLSRGG